MWDELKRRIENTPAYRSLCGALEEEPADLSVCGLYGSSRSLLLAKLVEEIDEPLFVIAPDKVKARDIEEDLRLFGLAEVVSYPDDEILPYDYHDPDRTLTGLQMNALDRLSQRRCRVLVCTLRAFLKKVFPKEDFCGHIVDIHTGDDLDPLELASRLAGLGYERHGIVEAKGQFALRGGILDIFEVSGDDPVRMEFDGEEIASMRRFDIETQRSTEPRSKLRVRPLHHLAPSAEGIARLRERLEKESEGMEEGERARMLLPAERLESGISFYGMEHYAAAVHDVVPLFEYFGTRPLVVFFDAEDIETHSVEFREEIDRRYAHTREEGRIYPRPSEIYVSETELEEWLRGSRRLRFRRLAGGGAVRFESGAPGDYRRNLKKLVGDVKGELGRGAQVYLFCSTEFQRDRAEEVLSEIALEIDFLIGGLSSGFRWPEIGALFLSEEEIFGRYHRPYRTRSASRSLTYDPSHFQPGDFVVHVSHGVGRYMGMRVLEVEGGQTECLDVRYEGGDHLFIPVSQLRMVEKHVAAEGVQPKLSKLGSSAWTRARERARSSAERVAKDILEVYAARQIAKGFAYESDKPWQKELEASFPYEETAHQLQATLEVKADMEAEQPMDRLLCGDVGFGKTEVAVRAAFKVVLSGKQCAILVPTTVLAMQHYNTVSERLRGFPVSIEMLSRFVSPARQKRTIRRIEAGEVDIVVGTHRLLSKDVAFKDLGMVIVDEEHRFGVKHKENFKKMKRNVDVLSMTATPIPRTLSMAVSGIRSISVIDTPPRNRLPIHTEILPFDDDHIRDAVMREVGRGGQVFFVHNRVQSIGVMEGYLKRLLPERVRVTHAHGQMRERELERKMVDFLEKRYDVLVCTMIIEAGLDFPNVNTIIINRADKFGLAQLYQLRGRVGRSDRKAYAFLLVPRSSMMTEAAVRRLQAISEFDYLGAGYRIAMRDLEIRGAGNFLGHQQSGHISSVGLDLYTRMLGDEVARLRGEPARKRREVDLSAPLPAFIPEGYVADSEERMDIYRRMTRVDSIEGVQDMRDELIDRFGGLPAEATNMLRLVEMKIRAGTVGIRRIEARPESVLRVGFDPDAVPRKRTLAEIAREFSGRITFHTEKGFSLSIAGKGDWRSEGSGERRGDAGQGPHAEGMAADLETLLNLLEFYDR
jgi:transcription-repair coupling factor (superfamily II helicase)